MNWYRQARLAHSRSQLLQSETLTLFRRLLQYSVTLFLILLMKWVPTELLWFHIVYAYAVIGYQLPAIVLEYQLSKYDTYKLNRYSRRRLFLFLMFENNPLLDLLVVYLIGNTLFYIDSPHQLLLLAVSFLWVIMGLWARFVKSFTRKMILFTIVGGSLLFWIVYPSFRMMAVLLLLLLFFYLWQYSPSPRHHYQQGNNRIRITSGRLFLILLPFYSLFTNYKRTILYSLLSLLGGGLCWYFQLPELGVCYLFYCMIDLELLLDKKYKHSNKFIGKHLFVSNSPLSFLQRFYLSDSYLRSMGLQGYSILFAVAAGADILAILVQVLALFLLGFIYHRAEEKMFVTQRKTNHLLFQYVVLLAVMGIAYIIGIV